MGSIITVVAIIVTLSYFSSQMVAAGGPRFDWNDEYDPLPGGPQCWIDGWDAGLENPLNQTRLKECQYDIGNPYYHAWMAACESWNGGNNTQETCELFADS